MHEIFKDALRPFAPKDSEIQSHAVPADASRDHPVIGERFIILCGTCIEPWVYTDEPFKMDHAAAVNLIASGEALDFIQAIAFDISRGTCRDATAEIAREVMTRWADNDEPISYRQREFLELHISIQAANSFAQAAE